MHHSTLLACLSTLSFASAKCYDPSPAFPVPLWPSGAKDLKPAFDGIAAKLHALTAAEGANKYDTSSFSIEVTSNTDTLWRYYHTARRHNASRPGDTHVDGNSVYRIASITKTFTTLGLLYQHAAGNLSLDDPVSQYIAEFADPDSSGRIPWKDITLRIMASQLSGIPREMGQADVINEFSDPTQLGLPPVTREGLPQCYEYDHLHRPCTKTELLDQMKKKAPLFAPNQRSTYSNLNFELLGLVLENVTGLNYSDYMRQAIFAPLDMASTSVLKPASDEHAVLPLGQFFWDVDEGIHSPTGAIYSSSADLSVYLRYVLTHYNALATGVNWMLPASWTEGLSSFYGMPWEIFRTDKILRESKRPVTFVTKAGGVPDYFSRISIMPEFGLGLTILVGGSHDLLEAAQEIVTVELIRAAEAVVWRDVDSAYTGTYQAYSSAANQQPPLNSSLTITSSPSTGLLLMTFISNGTDVFTTLLAEYAGGARDDTHSWRAQFTPTLLYKNETTQQGEIWRLVVVPERLGEGQEAVWDGFCSTDVDPASYAGLPINEFVFWREEGVVELPAWRVRMRRVDSAADEGGGEKLVVQPRHA
ncbi:hypothetical protein LTR36_006564 [Oleoguttula mirabilis]|uniref:Beta-lactamase-related domain-containing protein n=1 Tax=Oleoguttula mirabilis TaxID=1507867 RepID=A0AAV9JV19_9PEZI|nr:hypothetical protein LTR36_006564 [Oleoguttula mirabilis]